MQNNKFDLYYIMSNKNDEPFAYHKSKTYSFDEAIREILLNYGLIPQIAKTFEETAELQELLAGIVIDSLINKGQPIKLENKAHIAEEMADVLIMLSQIIIGLGLEAETEERMKFKIERQLARIEKERK